MRLPVGLVAIAVVAAASISAAGGDAKKDLALLQGNWKVVSIKESDDKKNPPPDVIKDMLVTFKGDEMRIMSIQKKETVISFKVQLDASKNPKTIDMIHLEGELKGKAEPGIYKIEGNTLTFCNDDVGKDRPKSFATKAGSTISMVVLQKSK